jgi:hypothetical protein
MNNKKVKEMCRWIILLIAMLIFSIIVYWGTIIYLLNREKIALLANFTISDIADWLGIIGFITGGVGLFTAFRTRSQIDEEIEDARNKAELKLEAMVGEKYYSTFDQVKLKPIVFIYQQKDHLHAVAIFFREMGFELVDEKSASKLPNTSDDMAKYLNFDHTRVVVYEVKPTPIPGQNGQNMEDNKAAPLITACEENSVNCVLYSKSGIRVTPMLLANTSYTTTVNFYPKLKETIHTMLYFDEK